VTRRSNLDREAKSVFAYHVRCRFHSADAEEVSRRWIEWLQHEHLADVVAAGALEGSIIAWDGSPRTVEVCYRFESRQAFENYERDHAPRLRAEGSRRFPIEALKLEFTRSTGTVI
jgi:hypothetical protein